MCFGHDGTDRISFGDKGSLDQEETPFNMNPYHQDANASLIPSMSPTMKGGSQMVIYDPIIVISTLHELLYCLAVIKSEELNIIGQNFMTDYRIVFDREKLVLGWKKYDCNNMDGSNSLLSKPVNSTNVPPAADVGQVSPATEKSEASK